MLNTTRRRRVTAVIILAVCAMLAVTGTAIAGKKFIYVRSQMVNVRSLPSIHGEVVSSATFGAKFLALKHIGDWYQVQLEDGQMGYIYDELVTDDHPERLWVDTAMANVRANPSAFSDVVASVQHGDELKSLGKGDDWYKVELAEGTTGWIHEDVVDDEPPGVLFVKVVRASVNASPSPMSEVLQEVEAGDELKKIMKFDDFYQVQLGEAQLGYISKRAVTDEPPGKVFVDVPEAKIKTDPTFWGKVSGTVKGGTELVSFDKEDDFFLVKTPEGELGWIYDDNVIELSD